MSLVIWSMCTEVSPFLSKKVTCQGSVLLIANEDGNWSLELKLRKKQAPLLFIQPMASWLECSVEGLLNGSYYPQWPPKGFCSHPIENAKQIDWVRVAVMMVHLGSGWPLPWAAVIPETHCVLCYTERAVSEASSSSRGLLVISRKQKQRQRARTGDTVPFSIQDRRTLLLGFRVWLPLLSSGFHSCDLVLSACFLCLFFFWILTDSLSPILWYIMELERANSCLLQRNPLTSTSECLGTVWINVIRRSRWFLGNFCGQNSNPILDLQSRLLQR